MTPQEIDSILIAWHKWGDAPSSNLGYPKECPSCRGYRSSKQWQGTDVDEAGETYLAAPDPFIARIGDIVDRLVQDFPTMHRLALAYQARALAIGSWAIRNPRLPVGMELETLLIEARAMLRDGVDGVSSLERQ